MASARDWIPTRRDMRDAFSRKQLVANILWYVAVVVFTAVLRWVIGIPPHITLLVGALLLVLVAAVLVEVRTLHRSAAQQREQQVGIPTITTSPPPLSSPPAPKPMSAWQRLGYSINQSGKEKGLRLRAQQHVPKCEYNEGRWWLTLDRPAATAAGFAVTVRHDTGMATRKEFGAADQVVLVRYPDDFETSMMPMKQPWGRYEVTWAVTEGTVENPSVFEVHTGFNWTP